MNDEASSYEQWMSDNCNPDYPRPISMTCRRSVESLATSCRICKSKRLNFNAQQVKKSESIQKYQSFF